MISLSSSMYPGACEVIVEGVVASMSWTPVMRSSGNISERMPHTRAVRSVGPARKEASPSYRVTLRWMKSRTSIRSCQGPGVKPRQAKEGVSVCSMVGMAMCRSLSAASWAFGDRFRVPEIHPKVPTPWHGWDERTSPTVRTVTNP